MGSIDDKLKYLSDTKTQLYDALKSKGSDITNETPFRNYPTEVYKLASGTYTPIVSPIGLRVWLDAIDNQGANAPRISGESNRWHPLVGVNSWINPDNSRTNYFDNDSVTFTSTTSYGFYGTSPYSYTDITNYNKDCTLELVFTLNEILSDTQHLFGFIGGGGGYSIRVNKYGNLYGNCYVGTNPTYTITPYREIPVGTKVYCCLRVKEGEAHFFNSYYEIDEFTTLKDALCSPTAYSLCIGYRGNDVGSYAGDFSHITVNSARYYTRYITDEEMMNNYLYDKSRFNVKVPKKLIISPNPSDATVILTATGYTQEGNNISVLEGTEVTYSVSKEGYTTQTGTVVVSENQTLNITLNATL